MEEEFFASGTASAYNSLHNPPQGPTHYEGLAESDTLAFRYYEITGAAHSTAHQGIESSLAFYSHSSATNNSTPTRMLIDACASQ